MSNRLDLYQYTCPACDYTLFSKSDHEELHCLTKDCHFKEILPIKNVVETKIENDSRIYAAKESFMVDHGCHEVRPITKGTKVEVIKIKKGWYLVETMDGFHFFTPQDRFERLKNKEGDNE